MVKQKQKEKQKAKFSKKVIIKKKSKHRNKQKKPPSSHSSHNSDTQDTSTKDDYSSIPPSINDILPIINAALIEGEKESNEGTKEDNIIYQKFLDAESALKISCNKCKKNITNEIKILIDYNLCENYFKKERFSLLCVNCFIKNILNNENNKNINYRVINKMDEYLLEEGWTVTDELKFIEAVCKLGFENWYEISRCIGKGFLECRSHYYNYYYKDEKDYLPNPNERKNLFDKINNLMNGNDSNYLSFNNFIPSNNNRTNASIRCIRNNRKIELQSKNNEIENDNENGIENEKEENINNKNIFSYLGYNPKRNEFDDEFKEEAELEISEMEFDDEINKNNKEVNSYLKDIYYKIFENYNRTLLERDERKNFVIQNDLIDLRKIYFFEKKTSKDDKDIYYSLRQCIKHLENNEYNTICQSFILEKNIGMRLNQLRFFKEIGCETFEEIHQYLTEMKKLNSNKKKKSSDNNNNDKNEKSKLRDRNNLKHSDDKDEHKSSTKKDDKEKNK